jgi:MFS family permease
MRSDEGVVPAATITGVALAAALVPLNSTMIAVALSDLAREFDVSKGRASMLITLYLVAMLVGQPFAGHLCDRFGARRVALIAIAGFGAFSSAAIFATSFPMLVTFRSLQAGFAACLIPSVQAMLRELVPEGQRGRAFGLLGSVIGIGAGLGPVVGGLSTAALGWRSIFGVNLPLVVVSFYVLRRRVPERAPHATRERVEPDSTDRVFNRVFTAAFLTQALSTLAQYSLLLVVPIVLDSRDWSAAWVGGALSLLTVGMVVSGPLGGRLGDSHGRRRPVLIGLGVALVAVLASAAAGDDVPSPLLVVTLAFFGLGIGAAFPSLTTAGVEAAPIARTGSASGLLSSSRYVGSSLSTVILAVVVGDDGSGLTTMLIVCAAGLLMSVVAARLLPGRLVGAPELVP